MEKEFVDQKEIEIVTLAGGPLLREKGPRNRERGEE
jgi:hypothetical protein